MESVVKFVQKKHPEVLVTLPIPSEYVVRNAFLPSNPYVGVTQSTHRINVVRKLTSKQMHKHHIDTHACNVLRRSVKDILFSFSKKISTTQMSEVLSLPFYRSVEQELIADLDIDINKRLNIFQAYRYISYDDKAKIPIGEPFYPISTGAHQKIGTKNVERISTA